MSSERGNVSKRGPPKHPNRSAFRNNLHDASTKQKMINSLEISGLCAPCKQVVEWKIQYKKYKPLSQAKTCVSCNGKTVKRAYTVVCCACAERKHICAKCLKEIHEEEKDEEKEETSGIFYEAHRKKNAKKQLYNK